MKIGFKKYLQKKKHNVVKTIPAYWLRKSFYLILEHIMDNVDKLSDIALTDEEKKRNFIKENFSIDLLSEEEKLFLLDKNISIETHYAIGNGIKQHFWTAVQTRLGEILSSGHSTAFVKKDVGRSSLQSEVANHFNGFKKKLNSNHTIRYNLALYLANTAKKIAKDKSKLSNNNNELNQTEKILRLIESYNKEGDGEEKKSSNTKKKIDRFWSNNTKFPKKFIKSKWICYERTDSIARSESEWGIAINHIEIGEKNIDGIINIELNSIKGKTSYHYKGAVTFDEESEYLVAQLFREIDNNIVSLETPAFFIMRITDLQNQTLVLGQYVYYSLFYYKFLTKTVIWSSDIKSLELFSKPDEFGNKDDRFKNIDRNIRKFLNIRSKNRLTIPSTNISSIDPSDTVRSLQMWIKKRIKNIENDDILRAYVGKYYVCYFYGNLDKINSQYTEKKNIDFDKKNNEKKQINNEAVNKYISNLIRIDELDISYNENSSDFDVSYTHKLSNFKTINTEYTNTESYFKGKVRRKRLTIEIILDEVESFQSEKNFNKNITPISNFILLNFCVPEAEIIGGNFNAFPGIVSGLSDHDGYPLSFRALVTRVESKLVEVVHDQQNSDSHNLKKFNISNSVIQYFRRHYRQSQIKVSPPSNNMFDKYPNIEHFILQGGSINIESELSKNGNITNYKITCSSNVLDFNQITIIDVNIEDCLAKVEYEISKYFNQC